MSLKSVLATHQDHKTGKRQGGKERERQSERETDTERDRDTDTETNTEMQRDREKTGIERKQI